MQRLNRGFDPKDFRIVNPAKLPLTRTSSSGNATKSVRSASLSAIMARTLANLLSGLPSVYNFAAIVLSPPTWKMLASPPLPSKFPRRRCRPDDVTTESFGFKPEPQGQGIYHRPSLREPYHRRGMR